MLAKSARPAEAERQVALARAQAANFEHFPEMALLYFWLTETGDQPLDRRSGQAEPPCWAAGAAAPATAGPAAHCPATRRFRSADALGREAGRQRLWQKRYAT